MSTFSSWNGGREKMVYQIKVVLKGSTPLVWRRVLLRASSTFEQLHQVIQRSFAFKDSHLYMFTLADHTLKVTNDDEALEVYQEYLENKEEIEAALLALDSPFARRRLEALRVAVHKPDQTKLESYLQVGDRIDYLYDFGDNWEFSIEVETIVEERLLDHPILLGGEHGAPLENMGGLAGFEEFLEAFNDARHPDHEAARKWGEQQGFSDYDEEAIQGRLQLLASV